MNPLRSAAALTSFSLCGCLVLIVTYSVIFRGLPAAAAVQKRGADAILMRPCTPQEERDRGDGREIWLQLRAGGKAFINENEIAPGEADERIAEIMSTRQEKVIYLIGEAGIPYERVAQTAASLQYHIDGLNIFLPTTDTGAYQCLVPNTVGLPRAIWRR